MTAIISIFGREILDSRGNPTVEVDVLLESGASGRASVPSGASTGAYEAVELRDDDKSRYHGMGVQKAIQAINGEIFDVLKGLDAQDQIEIDHTMTLLDGQSNKGRLGANAILGVSLANAKAAASELELPLYRYLGGVSARILPVPMINIINGGVHADNCIAIQEFMIMPISVANITEAIRCGAEIFRCLKIELAKVGLNTSVGDEGGFAPNLKSAEETFEFILKAIKTAGYEPEKDVVLALDAYNSEQMVSYYSDLIKKFPIFSIEDGLAEDDWEGWKILTDTLGEKIQLVGDDLFVTNTERLSKGIKEQVGNSILVKVNQIGTLTETISAVEMAHKAKYTAVMSHRSGETEDVIISDLAVAMNCGQIKTGSVCRSDRTAKYNQLIRIEEDLGIQAEFAGDTILKK